MAYKVIILYQLYMPSYFLGTFTEYPYIHVYPNCTLISVNMYITALLIIFFTFWQPLCHFQDLLLKPDK